MLEILENDNLPDFSLYLFHVRAEQTRISQIKILMMHQTINQTDVTYSTRGVLTYKLQIKTFSN